MRNSFAVLALLILVGGALLLNENTTYDRPTQATFSASIHPRVLDILEEANEVEVLISIRTLPIPRHYWSVDARNEPAAAYQESILDSLDEHDFALLYRLGDKPWLMGRITVSGLEKLRHHPYVKGIRTLQPEESRFNI